MNIGIMALQKKLNSTHYLPLASVLVSTLVSLLSAALFHPGNAAAFLPILLAGLLPGLLISAYCVQKLRTDERRLITILGDSHDESVDLVSLLKDEHRGPAAGISGLSALRMLSSNINGYLVEITRAALKFRLFSQDISFSASHLSDVASGQAQAMDRIHILAADYGQALQTLSRQFSSLSGELGQTSQAASNLAAKSEKSASALKELKIRAADAARTTALGKASVDKAEQARTDVCHALSAIATTLHRAEARTKTAEAALLLVDDIAERTRILATNASIEAAHAGSAGRGFAVIAGEIRKLAESAGASTAQVSIVLKQTMADIAEADHVASESEHMAGLLAQTGSASRDTFLVLEQESHRTEALLSSFSAIFSEVSQATDRTRDTSASAILALSRLGQSVTDQQKGYESISEDVAKAAVAAKIAAGSAGILSQLGTYLRVGGYDMDRSLRAFKVDEEKAALRHQRREKREMLIYNLEAFDTKGSLVAYLGDISPSGMLLYAESPLPIGTPLELHIRLPLSSEGERRMPVRCIPRRAENDGAIKRVGCSMIDEPATKKSVHELIERLGLSSLKASGGNQKTAAASIKNPGLNAQEEVFEELEEIGDA